MNAASPEGTDPIATIALTDPGEGLTEAEILEVKVAVGDRVEINDPVVEVETAKSAVELPSHVAGTVVEIVVSVGEEVPVGAPLLRVDTSGAPAPASAAPAEEPAAPAEQPAAEPAPSAAETADEEPKNLVGYGAATAPQRRRRRRSAQGQDGQGQVPIDRILAKPPVRKLARDLGVALHDVLATGPEGTVTREDVLAAQQRAMSGEPAAPDHEYFPEESPQAPEGLGGAMKSTRHQPFAGVTSDERTTRVPIRSVRRRTAEAMVASAFTAPHVTVFNEIDMTRALEIVTHLRSSREWADVKVSPLAVIAKALLVAIRRNPEVNASWDEAAQEIVYKHYVNLGIAAATPRGLIVPNLKDAHLMTLRELAEGISELARTARAGRTTLRDTRDGTITVTNYGVFDIDSGTPILNPGESAILGVGAIKEKPWVVDGQVVPRQVATLSLSFDHRLIDGALGAELLRDVSAVLEDPALGLVWG
ncbi:dihydrolipoamide acetyltransferase family protein [Brachybacterium sp. YJGR34]|uniref:dihydrolipoamide acetyltransferase family protein n=1 Tax=Brachybacterium sp. YJGR34 TaxID=2059911 RepID=UPI000E0B6D8A|nr:dihydrolipoamide acetyltransferase family protein [Brachybacterium sp. YJGR34]